MPSAVATNFVQNAPGQLSCGAMAEDRRSARRARLSAVRATYEGASGERKDAEVFDLSRGGLFLKSNAPVPVGKRLALEIHAAGEASPWPALGRVVWIRALAESENRPAGMAVKLIDVDDAVSEAIERLVQTREPTDRGLVARAAPPRERTILGVGLKPAQVPAAVVPVATVIVSEPPSTVIVSEPPATPIPPPPVAEVSRPSDWPGDSRAEGARGAPASGEPAVTGHRVASKSSPPAKPSLGVPDVPSHGMQDSVPAVGAAKTKARKRRGRGLLVAFFILIAATLAAYVYREALLAQWKRIAPTIHRALNH